MAAEPAAIPFAVNPATALTGVLNYAQPEHRKLYEKAITSLYERDDSFDCDATGLYSFLERLGERADQYNWNADQTGVLMIPNDAAVGADVDEWIYLVTEYGRIPIDLIRVHNTTYLNQQTRKVQDNYMLYQCLMASLSTIGRNKIANLKAEYTIDIQVADGTAREVRSGPLLLKIIIRESHIDTNATTGKIRLQLSSLDKYIHTVGHDMPKFNNYVRSLVEQLQARGEDTEDLLINLFKGYLECSDKVFVRYIERKKEDYDEGDDEMTSNQLMLLASNKYKILKDNDRWNAPSAEEEKILALEAQLESLKKKKNFRGSNNNNDKGKGKKNDNKGQKNNYE